MTKLEKIEWPNDDVTASAMTAALLSGLEVLADHVPDEQIKTAADAVEAVVSKIAKANEHSAAATEGVEIARSALQQIIRR